MRYEKRAAIHEAFLSLGCALTCWRFPGVDLLALKVPSYLHDLCKAVAKRAGLDETEWHLHRFRDTAATRWLRAGIDVRTVQDWLGHESLATTQKYLEPSKETENQLEAMKLPF